MKVIKDILPTTSLLILLLIIGLVSSVQLTYATSSDTTKAHRYERKADSLMKHNQYVDAIVFWDQASNLYEKALQWERTLYCRNEMTECWWRLGKLTEAQSLAEKVLDLSERYLGPRHLIASIALNHLGVVKEMTGRRVEALVSYQNALIIQKKRLGIDAVHPLLAKTYNNLGIISRIIHRYYQAEKYLNKAIDIEKKLNGEDATRVGLGYHNLGNVFHQKRAYSQALDYYYKANDIYQKRLPRLHVYKADNLNSMGQAFEQQGRFLDALIQFEKALKLYQQIHKIDHPDIAAVLSNLGECYFKINRYNKARFHHQKALRIYEKIYGQLHPRIAQGYLKLGNVFITQPQKNYYRAIRHFQKARDIQFKLYGKGHPLLAENYVYTGLAYVYQKNYQEALNWFQKSLVSNVYNFSDSTRLTNPSLDYYFDRKFFREALYFKAECLYFLAKQNGDQQKLLLALETLRLCDRLTDRMQYNQQYRLDQLLAEKRNQNMYELAFSIAAQIAASYQGNRSLHRKFLEEAFYFSEKSKAQVLRKSMNQLENQRKNLLADTIRQTDLNYKQQIAFFEQKLAQRSEGVQAQRYRNQLFQIKQAYKHWSDSLQQQYPRLHALRNQANLVTLQQIQYRLYSKTAVIAYTLHHKQSFAFVITANQVHLVPLGGTEPLIQQINQFYNEIQNESPLGVFSRASHRLYQALVQPLLPYLGRQNELVITDPTLLSVPLEALVAQKPPQWVVQQGKFSLLTYLNRRFRLQYHYSASLWWLGQKGYQSKSQNHSLKFYGFAPFSLAKKNAAGASNRFGQLPYSGQEISSIARLFKTQRQSAYTYLSDNATLNQFKESLQDMPESDNIEHILHIASHSTANLREERLAKIHFAPQKHPDSTYLYAESIYYLPLKAQLVVLSSCESGVGKFAPGEGVMSLARGFLHAGAKNVISSLWEADDQYAKKLMVLLYQQILFGRKTYTQALHIAKKQLIAQEPYLHPKYWSSFILIGR